MFTLTLSYPHVLHFRCYSTSTSSPKKLLDQLYQLARAANQTQSVTGKRHILQQYPQCQAILKRIYDPHRRHFVSSKMVLTWMNKQQLQSPDDLSAAAPQNAHAFNSLEVLLDALSSRQLSGHAALGAISRFYQNYCVTSTQQEIFWRVLDRDLKVGVSVQTIRRLLEGTDKNVNTTPTGATLETDEQNEFNINSSTPPPPPPPSTALSQQKQTLYDRRFMKVSLAMKMQHSDETKLWNSISSTGVPCYVSRKLDGVRCIALIQYIGQQYEPQITFCSRTGRIFDSLGKVERALQQQLLDNHDVLKQQQLSSGFVLDGEICVYPSAHYDDDDDDGDNGDCDAIGIDDNQDSRKEDFLAAVRQIRTLKKEMDHPVYQIFDLVTLDVFRQGKGGPPFDERQQQLKDLVGSYCGDYLQLVKQTPVFSKEQMMALKEKVGRFGWEGLIVRKNVSYEGKRSRNMLKIKKWEDAEYFVKRIETGTMRMPDTGQQKEVMTSVVITHKGNEVGVGSGFSLQQRLDYANNPHLILGKQITVRYFSESLGDSGNLSLRFPSVKAVYEGGRD
ncbi:hypothetical protein BCR42DRAFT_403395 [Absidia repens]|uniref:ATP-dependent DNA ligase family profile domain-containing protein n=1 Tax=Absidia repens TaxID=90262 RepID=A0A1X2IZD2_9FUNG|nr:hypothetical protein BCR42DRAFT_403395 [Absidia repens]